LVYRTSVDGTALTDYYQKVSNVAPTITIMKSVDKKIYGFYTSEPITNGWVTAGECWIFSLDHDKRYNYRQGSKMWRGNSCGIHVGDSSITYCSNLREGSAAQVGNSFGEEGESGIIFSTERTLENLEIYKVD